jgi:transposase InsO family protein
MKRVAIKQIVVTYRETNSVSKTARELNISRMTVYRWLKRCRSISQGLNNPTYVFRGVKRYSTRPKTIHLKLSLEQQKEVIKLRKNDHLGPNKISYLLKGVVSPKTVERFLKRQHLIESQVQYRRPKFQNGKAMRPKNTTSLGYLQMDTKHVTPELSGLPFTCFEYAVIDIVSRYKLAVILPEINDENASLALEFFLKWSPFPIKYIQTDNGLEYQRSFDITCQRYNITHYYIHKNTPNENAVIERSFRTDQDEFFYWLENQPQHLGELNLWLQEFINKYNTWRPHQALDYKTPLEVVRLYQKS